MRVGGEKNGLRVAMKSPECFDLFKKIAEGEMVFEDDSCTGQGTASLISSRLLRVTWSMALERSYFTSATPLIKYSLEELRNEGFFKARNVTSPRVNATNPVLFQVPQAVNVINKNEIPQKVAA